MIERIDLTETKEVARLNVAAAGVVSVRLDADETSGAALTIKRAIGPSGIPVDLEEDASLTLSGASIVLIDCHRFSHLVIEVTTAGTGGADLEWNTLGIIRSRLLELDLDLSDPGTLWEFLLGPYDRGVSVSIDPDDDAGTPAVSLAQGIDPAGKLINTNALTLDGSILSEELKSVAKIGLVSTVGSSGISARAWVYLWSNPELGGMGREGIAFLAASQTFTGGNLFEGTFQIGDASTGLHTIESNATASRMLEIPDEEGELVVMTDLTPGAGEYLTRDGDGYASTDELLAGDGSAGSPSIGFASDTDNGLFRSGADTWGLSCAGTALLTLADNTIFSSIDFDADIVNLTAGLSFIAECPGFIVVNSTAASGAAMEFREGTSNGTNKVTISAPDALSADVDIELPDATPDEGDGFLMGADRLEANPFANAIALMFEEGSNLSTSTANGYQFSAGNNVTGNGVGPVIPFDFEAIALSISCRVNTSGTATVELYKGADSDTVGSSTGESVSLSSGERHNFTVFGTPVSGDAGDFLLPRTTAASGTVDDVRFVIWVRPRSA